MAPEDGKTSKPKLLGLLRSYKAKREQRKEEEAARNTLAADRRWECLVMTGGTARRSDFVVSGYSSGRDGREQAETSRG